MKRYTHVSILAIALIVLALGVTAIAQVPLFRLAAETQWGAAAGDGTEYITGAAPGALASGGIVTYSKTFFNPYPVVYVSFDGAGAAHGGATLLMACTVNGAPCQAGGGGAAPSAAIPTGWVGLYRSTFDPLVANCTTSHIPGAPSEFADCHTNNLNYTWCAIVPPGPLTVELKLASLPGAGIPLVSEDTQVHYERAHIIIDGSKQPVQNLCVPDFVEPVGPTGPDA
jgi:hypothetical protein